MLSERPWKLEAVLALLAGLVVGWSALNLSAIGVTQRVIGPLTELSMVAAQENTRLAAELQIVALEALHDLYHRGYLQALDSMQRTLTSMGSTARLVTQAAERLQTAAIDAGRRVSETLESSVRESTRR